MTFKEIEIKDCLGNLIIILYFYIESIICAASVFLRKAKNHINFYCYKYKIQMPKRSYGGDSVSF